MYMYDAPCQIKKCSNITRGEDTWCHLCRRYLCRAHYDGKRHICRYRGRPDWYQEKWETLADLDVDAVKREAETLRPGYICTVVQASRDHSVRPSEGDLGTGINIHVPIIFDDGEEWLLRIPSYGDKPFPENVTAQTRESEVCTYKVLHAAGVAVPEVYSWGMGTFSKKKDPTFSHIVYEKLPGSPVWDMTAHSADQIDNMIDSYAEQMIKISEVSFDAIGGLKLSAEGKIVVGGMVDSRDTNAPNQADLGGPFHSMRERYLFQIDACLAAIEADMLFRSDPCTMYLAYLDLRDLVRSTSLLDQDQETCFYLKHPDETLDNFLIMENGEVSAILDWEWAMTTCKMAAFSAPRWATSDDYLTTDYVPTDLELRLCQAYERRGRTDLAECVRAGRVHNMLLSFLSLTSSVPRDSFVKEFYALTKVLDPDSQEELETVMWEWPIKRANKRAGDPVLKKVMEMRDRNRKSRNESRLAYPIIRIVSRLWKGFRETFGQ